MLGNLTGWHLIIILAVVLLLFGAAKLPALAKSVGQSAKIFKNEMKGLNDDAKSDGTTAEGAPSAANSVAPQASASESHPKP